MIPTSVSILLLIGTHCLVACWLAPYALPFMRGFNVARLADETGGGLIGAHLIGVRAAMGSMSLLVSGTAGSATSHLRGVAVLIVIGSAVLAGYALVHGLRHTGLPAAIWRQVFLWPAVSACAPLHARLTVHGQNSPEIA